MNKLLITLHGCHIMHSPGLSTVSPRVLIVVDGVYEFVAHGKASTFTSYFNELFTVGYIDRLTVVEVLVYNSSTTGCGDYNEQQLLGTCRLSTVWLFQGKTPKRRRHVLANDAGIAGTVELTLMLDTSREGKGSFEEETNEWCASRLVRFLMHNDKGRLRDVDLLLSTMETDGAPLRPLASPPKCAAASSESSRSSCAAFEELMRNLCEEYHCEEPPQCRVRVALEGCTSLEESDKHHSSNVIVVFRSTAEEFVSPSRPYTSNPVWGSTLGTATFDVCNPEDFVLDVIVYRITSSSGYVEVGRARIRVYMLTTEYSSKRQYFIFRHDSYITPCVTGAVHITIKPLGFGLSPKDAGGTADLFHARLNRFFYRYDRRRLQEVDIILYSRRNKLDELMDELEVYYGREPGTAVLCLTVEEVQSLLHVASTDLDGEDVVVVVTMGSQSNRTDAKRVTANSRIVFGNAFQIDVVRETDMIRFEVVKAGCEDVVYGSVDFTCLRIQKGVENTRTLYLVGAAGTEKAFLSGTITVTFFSENLGQSYTADTESECMYAGRLRRYACQHAPEKLHLVDVAVATVFDTEGFMKEMSRDYGEENPTYVLYMTVLGCRKLRKRFGFTMSAYVVARMGVDRYETRVVRNSTKPDYFEFFEFFIDQFAHTELTLVVMDQYDMGTDKEVGRTVIPLENAIPEHQYNLWLPLMKDGCSNCGFVGVKFVVKDLQLRDSLCDHVKAGTFSERCGPRQEELTSPNESRRATGVTNFSNALYHLFGGWGKRIFRAPRWQPWRDESSKGFSKLKVSEGVSGCEHGSDHPVLANIIDDGIYSASEFLRPRTARTAPKLLSNLLVKQRARHTLVPQTPNSTTGRRFLHVHLHYCDDLEERRLVPPSPCVMLATLRTTYISRTAFETCSPRYDDVFHFPITCPDEDFLTITVMTDTPYGRKTLGFCMLSIKNVCYGMPQTRYVALVVAPHGSVAQQRGVVCLSLLSENFGVAVPPPLGRECSFRQWLQSILVKYAPTELHRLEWYVGEYSVKDNREVEGFFVTNTYKRRGKEEVNVHISVETVSNLHCDGLVVASGSCSMTAELGGRTVCRIPAVEGSNGFFNISGEFDVVIPQPLTQTLRLLVSVKAGSKRSHGECVISFADVHRKAARGQAHYIVEGPGLPSASPIGYVTVSMSCDRCGRVGTPSDYADRSLYTRMRDYYYYYIRERLHVVNVTYSKKVDVDNHLRKLVEVYGPEPSTRQLHLEIVQCNFPGIADGTPYFALEVGLLQYRTVPVADNPDSHFKGSFDIHLGLPEKDELNLIVFMSRACELLDVEVGRTLIPLRNVVCGKKMLFRLPLVRQAQTKYAKIHGSVEVLLYTNDFGLPSEQQRHALHHSLCDRVQWEVSHSNPKDIHRIPNFLAGIQVQSGWVSGQMECRSLPRPGSASDNAIRVLFLGFQCLPEKGVYIKVKLDGCKKLLRTGDLSGKRLACVNEEFTIEGSAVLKNTVFTLKLAESKTNESRALCYCDFTLADCPPGCVSRKWLRLFDDRGRSMGQLGIQVDAPASSSSFFSRSSSNRSHHDVERVTDDVVSLLQKYLPQGLRRLDLIINHSDNVSAVHRVLRKELAPKVQATIYCQVQQIRLRTPARIYPRVEFSSADEVQYVTERTYGECMVDSNTPSRKRGAVYLHFSSVRLDVNGADALRISVHDGEAREGCEKLGSVVLSLRALLTPTLYGTNEILRAPLVKLWRTGIKTRAVVAGTITFHLSIPIFERYPAALCLSEIFPCAVDRDVIRCYFNKISSVLRCHDTGSLVDIHRKVFEELVVKPNGSVELRNFLHQLAERWGVDVSSLDATSPDWSFC
ncbi:hypothetical protein, conserved [Trypanosoma brucei brucei TREU927]|uniref:C2 domain-containing protein n=1 Tax=Trypanosoma brucei brucei (strain 927/4 GUTat10.1) TaxID=185431 RepID=Q38A06_TRYB2|nr:hypothetical protein, conserved [Trypanosoma brucei brucei TREU927]EAN78364.1 hypothetical protein, conserved [Trypanosoma brucei brucei TREU927]